MRNFFSLAKRIPSLPEMPLAEFLTEDAIRIARDAYADAIRDMSEDVLLDEEARDNIVNTAIGDAFRLRALRQNR